MDDHVSGLPKLAVPGKVNWELLDTFHIKTADAIVRINWDRDSYCIVKVLPAEFSRQGRHENTFVQKIRCQIPVPFTIVGVLLAD